MKPLAMKWINSSAKPMAEAGWYFYDENFRLWRSLDEPRPFAVTEE
ncbi:MAG: hypothetical protein FWG66_14555 [Spirochaetes bacterium]|nr:hypothetical protein [Spirochaetota bacterium]